MATLANAYGPPKRIDGAAIRVANCGNHTPILGGFSSFLYGVTERAEDIMLRTLLKPDAAESQMAQAARSPVVLRSVVWAATSAKDEMVPVRGCMESQRDVSVRAVRTLPYSSSMPIVVVMRGPESTRYSGPPSMGGVEVGEAPERRSWVIIKQSACDRSPSRLRGRISV